MSLFNSVIILIILHHRCVAEEYCINTIYKYVDFYLLLFALFFTSRTGNAEQNGQDHPELADMYETGRREQDRNETRMMVYEIFMDSLAMTAAVMWLFNAGNILSARVNFYFIFRKKR